MIRLKRDIQRNRERVATATPPGSLHARPADAVGTAASRQPGRPLVGACSSRPTRPGRAVGAFAAVALLALFALFAAPMPASAQSDIWSATMTVGSLTRDSATTSRIGYGEAFNPNPAYGSLSDTTFATGGTDYTVRLLAYGSASPAGLKLFLTDRVPEGLVLHLGDSSFDFSDATITPASGDFLYSWTNPGLNWADDATVAVRLAPEIPTLSIAAGSSPVEFGSIADFTVSRTGITDGKLPFRIRLKEEAGRTGTYHFLPGQSTVTISHLAWDRDNEGNPLCTITFVLVPRDAYSVSSTAGEATVIVTPSSGDTCSTAGTPITPTPVYSGLAVTPTHAVEGLDPTMDFVVTLQPAATSQVTVDYATEDGTARAGADYTTTSGTLTFEVGEGKKTVAVPIIDDDVEDSGERLRLRLSNASGATITLNGQYGIIYNSEEERQAAQGASALSASFENVPASHDGESAFTFGLRFGEDVEGLSYETLRDEAFDVDGGTVSNARRLTQGSNQSWEIEVEPDSRGAVTITLPAGGVVETSDGRRLGGAVSATVAGPPEPLTASFQNVPASHAGENDAFDVRILFDAALAGSWTNVRDAITVTNGTHTQTNRVDGRSDLWNIGVEPTSNADVTVRLAASVPCDEAGPLCTSDGRRVEAVLSTTIEGPEENETDPEEEEPVEETTEEVIEEPASMLSISDARATEGVDGSMSFTVTLSPVASDAVTVEYATADGSAQAGQDYTGVSGVLRFSPDETSKAIEVTVLDDGHDEGENKFYILLYGAEGAEIADRIGNGVIVNSDPMPQSWLGRFGRAASDHVVEAIGARLRGGVQQTQVTVGGRRVDRLFGLDRQGAAFHGEALPDDSRWASMDPLRADGPAGGGSGSGLGGRTRAGLSGTTGQFASQSPGFGKIPNGIGLGGTGAGQVYRGASDSHGLPELRDVIMGSSFFYSRAPGEEAGQSQEPGWLGQWSAWGRTAATRFSGADGPLSLNGEVATTMLGVDSQWDRWLAGVVVSHSEGEGAYTHTGAFGGDVKSSLTSLHPFASYALNERTSFWGVLGYGVGGLSLTPEGQASGIGADLATAMAAFGGRGVLSRRAGGFGLAVVSDALVTNTVSESVEDLMGAAGATSRLRVMLEGSGSLMLATGGVLRPTLEAGLRYDGGDAETGAGLEVGGGLAYIAGRVAVEVNARTLLAHEDTEYEEWGFSSSITYLPGSDGRGLSMKLGSAWGATQSGVQLLWTRQDASGLGHGAAMDAAQRFQAELGYGLNGRKIDGLWYPYFAAEAADGGEQVLRMGLRLTSGPNVRTGLALGQRERGREAPENALQLTGMIRW